MLIKVIIDGCTHFIDGVLIEIGGDIVIKGFDFDQSPISQRTGKVAEKVTILDNGKLLKQIIGCEYCLAINTEDIKKLVISF